MVFCILSTPSLIVFSAFSNGSTPLLSSFINSLFFMSISNGFSTVIPRELPSKKSSTPNFSLSEL
jgi:hypothetical protein